MITLYVVIMFCVGDCSTRDPDVLAYFNTRESCDAAVKRYGVQHKADTIIDGADPHNPMAVLTHEEHVQNWHAECRSLELKP